jgi:hypothetical protein
MDCPQRFSLVLISHIPPPFEMHSTFNDDLPHTLQPKLREAGSDCTQWVDTMKPITVLVR